MEVSSGSGGPQRGRHPVASASPPAWATSPASTIRGGSSTAPRRPGRARSGLATGAEEGPGGLVGSDAATAAAHGAVGRRRRDAVLARRAPARPAPPTRSCRSVRSVPCASPTGHVTDLAGAAAGTAQQRCRRGRWRDRGPRSNQSSAKFSPSLATPRLRSAIAARLTSFSTPTVAPSRVGHLVHQARPVAARHVDVLDGAGARVVRAGTPSCTCRTAPASQPGLGAQPVDERRRSRPPGRCRPEPKSTRSLATVHHVPARSHSAPDSAGRRRSPTSRVRTPRPRTRRPGSPRRSRRWARARRWCARRPRPTPRR